MSCFPAALRRCLQGVQAATMGVQMAIISVHAAMTIGIPAAPQEDRASSSSGWVRVCGYRTLGTCTCVRLQAVYARAV